MSLRRFFGRLDDWMNPIVVKELRQAVQSKFVVGALMLYLALQVLILGGFLLSEGSATRLNVRLGRELFGLIQGIMFGTFLLVPVYVGGRLAVERSDTHTDLLFITALKPRAIVSGKYLSGVVLILLVFSACMPFLTFTYLLRGVDIPTILVVLGLDLLITLWALSGTVFLAVLPMPWPLKLVLGIGTLLGMMGLFSMGMTMTMGLLAFGMPFDLGTARFWGEAVMVLAPAVCWIGLLFTWSVAILSPGQSNRALLVRLYVLGTVVVLGVIGYLASKAIGSSEPLAIWIVVAAVLCSLQMFLSINEREKLGKRVARTIPRNALLRIPAFLLYSGSAGGMLFSGLLLALSIAAAVFVEAADLVGSMYAVPGFPRHSELVMMIRFAIMLGGYTYCFCMTAILVRSVVLRNHVRPIMTWLVALLILGLASVLPYLVLWMATGGDDYYMASRDVTFLLTNPFISIEEGMRWNRGTAAGLESVFEATCVPFLFVWGCAVSAAAIPWLGRQLSQFRRIQKTSEDVDNAILLEEVPPVARKETVGVEPLVLADPVVEPPSQVRKAP